MGRTCKGTFYIKQNSGCKKPWILTEHAENNKQKETWLSTAGKIRAFVSERCMTSDGTYAGSEAVDITAALYPVWWLR